MGVIASTEVIERHCEVQLSFLIIIMSHSAQVGFGSIAFDDFHDFDYFEL
jgi:hypothetical protein